jgi:putative transposase
MNGPFQDKPHTYKRYWWKRFGTIFGAEIRRNRVQAMRSFRHRQWHLDEVFVKINGVKHDLWRAVDHGLLTRFDERWPRW